MEFEKIVKDKTDLELLKMVHEFDKWNTEMLRAVEQELTIRNKLPSDILIKRKQLIDQEKLLLTAGKEPSLFGQVIGWLTIFGLGGIFIGYNYAFSKVKSKYSNEMYFKYNESARRTGKNMFYISILLTSLGIMYRILSL